MFDIKLCGPKNSGVQKSYILPYSFFMVWYKQESYILPLRYCVYNNIIVPIAVQFVYDMAYIGIVPIAIQFVYDMTYTGIVPIAVQFVYDMAYTGILHFAITILRIQ